MARNIRPLRNLILFGFPGSGKSYWGERLAAVLDWEFIDTDRLIEKRYERGLSCREIYHQIGEERFRTLEREVIAELHPTSRSVIAVGGGTVLCLKNTQHLQTLGHMIYLKTKPLRPKGKPAYLETTLEELYNKRVEVYETIPAYVLELDSRLEASFFCV